MVRSKSEWRRVLLGARRGLDARLREVASAAIVDRVGDLPAFDRSRGVLLYESLGAESDPGALAARAKAAGKGVYQSADEAGRWIASARDGATALADTALCTPLVVVVPGVGFDPDGTRLGRGRGFYDRALASLRARHGRAVLAVGVGFEVQVVARLPRDPWDEPVDLIATEHRLIVPGAGRQAETTQDHAQEVRNS